MDSIKAGVEAIIHPSKEKKPSSPRKLSAKGIGATGALLKWEAPKGVSTRSYQILIHNRATDPVGVFSPLVLDTKSLVTQHEVINLEPKSKYVFRITAHIASGGLSSQSKPLNFNTSEEEAASPEKIVDAIMEGTRAYTPSQVIHALQQRTERSLRLFGGQTSDSKVIAIHRESVDEFLQENAAGWREYTSDRGEVNYDCDNFADSLRSNLNQKHGLNSVGIIRGDSHIWNFFVICGNITDGLDEGPRIMMVDPQNDMTVEEFTGVYSINRRCEVYL